MIHTLTLKHTDVELANPFSAFSVFWVFPVNAYMEMCRHPSKNVIPSSLKELALVGINQLRAIKHANLR